MKRLILLAALTVFGYSSPARQLLPGQPGTTITATETGYIVNLSFGDVNVNPAGEGWHRLSMPGAVRMLEAGAPEMLYQSFSLLVPEGDVELKVLSSSYVYYNDIDIVPSKGNLTRDIDPATVPLTAGAVYQQDAYFPAAEARMANEYDIRQAHGRAVQVYPVQYNPSTHTVRVCLNMQLLVKTRHAHRPAERVEVWNNLYRHHFLNYDLLPTTTAKSTYSALPETGDMLIVTPGQYLNALQPFMAWKKERGIRCHIMNLDTLSSGGDPDSIRTRIAWHYQQNGNLAYLLLIGDESDLPPIENNDVAGPSDAAFGYIVGNDHYPDLLIGRFSANSLQELQPQLTKSIKYEKNPTAAQNWYTRAMGIASDEGPGDDNQMDWEHMIGIRTQLLGATYTYVYEAYDGTHDNNLAPLDGHGNPNQQEVIDAINSGLSLINYCGHGSTTSMATTGFSNNDVPSLTNTNGQWPFIITVACVTGEFMNGHTSLGERLMTAQQSGQPYGMVGGFMSSINQYWDPPMQGQDEMMEIISGISATKAYAAAAITTAGTMSMNDNYTGAGYDMTDTWIFFGDPSLQLRYDAPDTLVATHADSIYYWEANLAALLNKEYGTVVLLHNDTIYSVQTATNYNTSHNFAPLPAGDSLVVVATAPNTVPYYGKIRIVDTPLAASNLSAVQTHILLYPNPARDKVVVRGLQGEASYRCMDMLGRTLLSGQVEEHDPVIQLTLLPAGTYMIQLYTKDGSISRPLQVSR